MSSSPISPSIEGARFEPPNQAYQGYIFDCDGTLADSMVLHFEAWCQAFAAHAAPFEFNWELFMRRAGKTLEVTVAELNQEFGCALDPDRVAGTQRRHYGELLPQVGPIAPVVEYARGLLGRYPLSVASGGDRDTVESTLRNLGILEWFPVVVVAADVTHGKPAPDMFLRAAELMGVPARECVVFEDSLLGIEGAERAGMGSVLVRALPPAIGGARKAP